MSRVLALVPARAGSKGIPGKNFRLLGHQSLAERAAKCAMDAFTDGVCVAVSTDLPLGHESLDWVSRLCYLHRPSALAQDDTPMLDVVKHALGEIPGEPDDIIVLLQPTQPFRTPEHIRQAVQLLRDTNADSVVSVVELPRTHHPHFQYTIGPTGLLDGCDLMPHSRPTRRQDVVPTFRFDGTVYAFRRRTVDEYGSIYGFTTQALIIPANESCELDTLDDWTAAERRWKEQHG